MLKKTLLGFSLLALSSAWGQKAPERTWIFLGDSLVSGYGVSQTEAYPKVFEKLAQKNGAPLKVVNGGEPGSIASSASKKLPFYLKRIKGPKLIYLCLGGNDARKNTEPNQIKAELRKAILIAQSEKVPLVLCEMKIFDNYGKSYTQSFNKIYHSLSKEHSIPLVPFLLSSIAGKPEFFQPDGLHPNKKGHEAMAKALLMFYQKSVSTWSKRKT